MAWLTEEQMREMGFACFGKNVMLSDKASFFNCKNIRFGSNIRIDDFCVFSAGIGGIDIGDYIHVAVFTSVIGAGNITLADFCNISSRVSIYSSNDDYSGTSMTNPMVSADFTNVRHADVRIGRHVIIGAGSIILPGVILGEGAAVGALSFVTRSVGDFSIVAGVPAKHIRNRKRDILDLEYKFIQSINKEWE